MRALIYLGLALLTQACVSGTPIWTEQSAQIEFQKQPGGFLPPGGRTSRKIVQRRALAPEALAQLQAMQTIPLEAVTCKEDAGWVRTLRIFDKKGGSQVYYADDYACPKNQKRLIVKGESLDALEKLLP